jgi:signal transduction histidine kinase
MAQLGGSTRGAVHSALRVLLGVSGAESISLWRTGSPGAELVAAAGDAETALPELRAAAAAVFAGRPASDEALTLVTIDVPGETEALLAAHDPGRDAGAHTALMRAARPSLTSLLSSRASGAEDAAAAVERRLDRLRYDLHDGPQQDVHLLAQDLRLFREQLGPMISAHPDRDRALGRLDDLEAQLIALDSDLRRLATSAGSPLLGGAGEGRGSVSLPQSLIAIAEAFTARSGIVPRTELSGDVDTLTDSQQIALLSLVRESLTNVRQHSGATHVSITVSAGEDHVIAEIRDDGDGFAVAEAGTRAAQSGHLGLIGMRERMRMLGGDTTIASAPGGPTVVTATLPRWPVDPAAA